MIVGLYRAATRLLPPDMRRDRDEIVRAFAALWQGASTSTRVRLALRSFAALPAVLVLEWLEFLGARSAPGRTRSKTSRHGRGGMGFWRSLSYAPRTLREKPAATLWADTRQAARKLAASPGLTTAAVMTLVVGIGSSVAVFSRS
jgi:hypothetical protein